MNVFKDKIAIVTGGGSGIGRSVCDLLGKNGAIVIVTDINLENAEQVSNNINTLGGTAKAAKLDVTREKDVWGLVNEVKSKYGKIDYMFNNAGITITGLFQNIETDHWRRIFDIDFWGVLYGTKAAYAIMLEQGFGHIINTSSTAGLLPAPLEIPYMAAKFAVVGLSSSLRMEANHFGIKISVVCPGFIDTPIWDTTKVTQDKKEVPARLEEILGEIRFKSISADDAARYILRGVEKKKAYIVFPFHARLLWWLYRIWPTLLNYITRKNVSIYIKN